MIVCGYVRVSSVEQASDKHYSIGEQTDRLKAYCEAKGWTLKRIYTDGGYSGKNLDRPAMRELISECKMYDLVLVNKLDRLSRSQKDTLYLIEDVFRANGVQFASITENFDTTTPLGIAMIGILSVFAQLEREQIKERMHMGRVGRVKKGLWHTTGKPPIGYDYVDGHLIINENEAEQIRVIYQRFLAGETLHAISKYMHSHYVNKYSSWNQSNSVGDVLRDPLYIGKVKFDGVYYDGEHQPIIDEETFYAAQDRYALISHQQDIYINAFKSKHLLTGMMWCGECGARYSISTNHTKCGATKRSYVYYGCRGRCGTNQEKIKSNHCKNRYYKKDELENLITGYVMDLDIEDVTPKKGEFHKPDNSKKIAEIEKQISKLLDLYTVDGISLEDIKNRIEKLTDQKNKLIQSQEEEPKREKSIDLVSVKAIMQNGTIDEKRAILTSLIRKITLYADHIDIEWNF